MSNTTVYFLSLLGVIIGCLGVGMIIGFAFSKTAVGELVDRFFEWDEDDARN